ncbi:DUF2157 domain-containing protein [Sporomusa aerivorans]|uniref:DUF2157 domain-containing protein n=1 Tax=Sporomusa aerivorans TaxID=204936 RepID=UPI00352A2181
MNKKAVEWLYRELPGLVDKGIIPAESAERLKQHYGPVEDNTGTKTFLLVFGLIGALLIGLGIVLILAHNWEQLSKLSRLIIAVGLLVAAQALAGGVLWFKRDSLVWLESAATILMLMIGASMALVGQTYHLVEDTDSFLLTWMLVSLPLVYLMNSASVAVLYTMGVTAWAVGGSYDISKQYIWLLLGMLLPYYWRMLRERRYANSTVIVSWTVSICFYFSFGAAFTNYLDHLGLVIYCALFTIHYLAGVLWFNQAEQNWRMPFKIVGLAGSTGLLFILTFQDIWRHLIFSRNSLPIAAFVLLAALLALVIGGNVLSVRRNLKVLHYTLIPCAAAVAYVVQVFDNSGLGATAIMNAYVLWLSISIIIAGIHKHRLGIVNTGMLLLAALIVARFFDVELSFVVRGVAFVLVGIGFIAANVVLVRRKAGWENEK